MIQLVIYILKNFFGIYEENNKENINKNLDNDKIDFEIRKKK